MSTIAIIADIHLPPESNTLKDKYLDYALQQISKKNPDLLLMAGDATSTGALPALQRFYDKLDALSVKKLSTIGNSDLRTPSTNVQATDMLETGGIKYLDDCTVVLISYYDVEKDLRILKKLAEGTDSLLLICSHFSLTELKPQVMGKVKDLLSQCPKSIFVAGHLHENVYSGRNENPQHLICGLDPDKAVGGPCVTYFETDGSDWQRQDAELNWLTPENWSSEIIKTLLQKLGFSTMNDPIGGLEYAAFQRIPCVELRAMQTDLVDSEKLNYALTAWRTNIPEHCLSMHLDDVTFDEENILSPDYSLLKSSVKLAISLGVHQVTVHLPGFDESFQNDSEFFNQIIRDYTELLKPLIKQNIIIGFENMHLNEDQIRGRFGCSPHEAVKWIDSFKEFSNYSRTGLHFDQGHARNNGILGRDFNISQWYAIAGHMITGYHLHQVSSTSDGMINHTEFISPYGKLIPLTSFFAAWHEKIINRAPVFLEIRGEGIPTSLMLLRNYLLLNNK